MVNMAGIGTETKIQIATAITGTGVNVEASGTWINISAPTPKISLKLNSKISNNAFHKSRISPDLKYVQSYSTSAGQYKAELTNDMYEMILDAYIAKNRLYLLVDMPDGSGGWEKKSWYDGGNLKVYYLKGFPVTLDITQKEGKIWNIAFKFSEVWF